MIKRFWTLKRKLLVFSVALVSIPFLSIGFLKQLEQILVDNLLNNLSSYASSIAFSLNEQSFAEQEGVKPANETHRFFVSSVENTISIDGFLEDWLPIEGFSHSFSGVEPSLNNKKLNNESKFTVNFVSDDQYLFGMLQVRDKSIAYREALEHGSVSDKAIIELFNSEGKRIKLTFSPFAVGGLRPIIENPDKITFWVSGAQWQEFSDGYIIEFKVPLLQQWRGVRITVSDYDSQSQKRELFSSVLSEQKSNYASSINLFVWPDKQLEEKLEELQVDKGKRVWVLDANGQVQARRGNLIPDVEMTKVNPLIHFLLAPPLSGFADPRARAIELNNPSVEKALKGEVGRELESIAGAEAAIAFVAYPIQVDEKVMGVVAVEETVAAIQMIQRRAMNIYVNTTLVILLIVIVSLIVVASRLTHRIMRLNNSTIKAVDEHGRIKATIHPETASDEIGELSRSFAQMSLRLKEYNEYMEKLAARLTHELRTPIAVVRSSIDNIALSEDESIRDAVIRAQSGIDRLSDLISRMREAARLEQSVLSAERDKLKLAEFVSEYINQVSSLFTEHRLVFSSRGQEKPLLSSPELIAQLLDKLISNARDFAPENSDIEVALSFESKRVSLAVINEGSQLPDATVDELFSSMASRRSEKYRKPDQTHLGLGLYIVRLIAEAHRGKYFARNLEERRGVMIGVELPYL
ncbi:ATP-binding protein [Pleionea sediminis]|uniref:ATP-binding protein n=1 Tax=Pleionea sediminis TaxID=2569479 RepID=UPI00118526A4|nr:ATP-binding protein [Pleionea sediminis]